MNEFQHMAPMDDEQVKKGVADQLLLLGHEPSRTMLLKSLGLPPDATMQSIAQHIEDIIRAEHQKYDIYRNDTYQVAIYNKDPSPPGWPRLIHLLIKRNDR